MFTLRSAASMGIVLASFYCVGCAIIPHADTQDSEILLSAENGLVVPYDCIVYLYPVGGRALAITEIGLGTSESDFESVFSGLPNRPSPASEIRVGRYKKGRQIPLCLRTEWLGNTHYAFCNRSDDPSKIAFEDSDNSLGLGGHIIEKGEGSSTWTMHMDDAASFLVDDSDNDVIIRIRLERQ